MLENGGGDSPAELIEGFVTQHYDEGHGIPRELLVLQGGTTASSGVAPGTRWMVEPPSGEPTVKSRTEASLPHPE